MTKIRIPVILLFLLTVFIFSPVLLTATRITGNYGDVYRHYYPMKSLVLEHLIRGELPLWNPYIFAGQPLLSNPQSAVFYPLGILFYLLPLPAAFNYFYLVHFFLAGILMFLFLTASRFSSSASCMGSIAFAFSSFLVYQVPAGHPAALSGFVWLPLIMLLTTRLAPAIRPRTVILLAAVLSFQFLSGHPFPFYITLVYLLLYSFYRRLLIWKSILAVIGIFTILSSVQLLPTLELSQATETANWPALVKSYSLSIRDTVTAAIPGYLGSPLKGNYIIPESPSYFFEKNDLYFGLVPLLLSIAGLYLSLRRRKFFFPIIFAAGLLLAFGFSTPLYRFLYDHLPGLDYLRVPARFYFLSLVALVCCACLAWDTLVSPRRWQVKLGLIALLFIDLSICNKPFVYSESMDGYRQKSSFAGALSPLYRVITDPESIAPNKSMLYHHFNLNGYEAILLTDFTRYMGLQEKRVFNATGLERADLLSPLARGFSAGYYIGNSTITGTTAVSANTGGARLFRFNNALPRVYIAKQSHLIPDDEVYDQIDYLKTTARSPDETVLLPAAPRWFNGRSGGGSFRSFKVTPARLSVELLLDAPSILVFSELMYPGWQAYAANSHYPLLRGNKIFRTLVLPAGDFSGAKAVTLIFRPISLSFGLLLTLISLLAGFTYACKELMKRNC